MKREIKFRGKRTDNGEWIVGNLFIPNKLVRGIYICPETTYGDFAPGFEDTGISYEEFQKQQHGITLGHFREVIPDSVGQYTGLQTSQEPGEIYEGDILQFTLEEETYTEPVVFDDGCFWCKSSKCLTPLSVVLEWNAKNIGNIHDNPSLINNK